MKQKCLFASILIILILSLPEVSAQNPGGKWRRTEPHWQYGNSISFGLSVMSVSNYNGTGLLPLTLDYDRFFSNRFSWGVSLQYSQMPWSFATCSYTLNEHFLMLAGRLNYVQPVVKNRFYLKIGFGIGAGYHKITEISRGMVDYDDDQGPRDEGPIVFKDKLLPHLLLDIHWIIRVSRKVDIMIAPLTPLLLPPFIFCPSRIVFTPFGFDAPYNNSPYINYDLFGRFAVGIRF